MSDPYETYAERHERLYGQRPHYPRKPTAPLPYDWIDYGDDAPAPEPDNPDALDLERDIKDLGF